jgi:hypothetical protein
MQMRKDEIHSSIDEGYFLGMMVVVRFYQSKEKKDRNKQKHLNNVLLLMKVVQD